MDKDQTIAAVATATGLSKDTLRWYEAEGLIPPVPRDASGRRHYDEPTLRMIDLLVRLRRTGMPVKTMRAFVQMIGEGAQSHGRRMQLLTDHREDVLSRIREMLTDLDAVDAKIAHYGGLINQGLDCDGRPVDPHTATLQQRTTEDNPHA